MRPLPNNVVVSNLRCVPLLALLCCLFAALSARAQTTLSPGDIAFTYGDDGSSFSFVLLVDVDSGTSISFDSNSGLGGDTRTWTASGAQTAGTVFTETWGDFKKEGCYAYQGSANCSNVIAEFSLDGWGSYSSCNPAGGQSIEFDEQSSRTYTGARLGSKSDLLAALGNTSNWSSGSSNNTSPFVVGCATSLFTEDFSNESGTSGSSAEGVNWSSSGSGDQVDDNRFRVARNGTGTWTTSSVSVSDYASLVFSCDVSESGSLEAADNITIEVKVDGTAVYTYTHSDDNPLDVEQELIAIAGSNAVIVATATNNASNERWFIDNVSLIGVAGCTDVDEDCICDDLDFCTDTSALNYDDPANEDCAFEVFFEPFTDDSQFSKNVNFSHDGSADYWGIYDPDGSGDDFDGNSGQPSGVGSFSGVNGNFLVGEDMNEAPVVADPGILTWSNIDISAYDADLTFELDIAERGATSDEFVELYAKLSSASTYTLLIDPGSSIGSIGSTFSTQSASGSFDGTSLDIQLRMYSDDGGDEVAVDNLRVAGTISCSADVDSDGLCDDSDGCTNTFACNYADPNATSCEVPTGCESCSTADGNGTIVDNDADDDGVCDNSEDGCTDTSACNWNDPNATSCSFATGCDFCSTSDGNGTVVDNDVDGDGLCDDNGDGCTDTNACNYAVPSASSCVYLDGVCETCVNGEVVDNDADNDGVCDADEVTGCTDDSACNYDDDPTTDTNNGLCEYATGACESCSGETDGTGTVVVTDTTAPTITPQAGVTVFADGSCQVSATGVALGTPATSDNCGVASVTNDAPSTYPLGVTTVTWTVTDINGNTASATQTVTVVDNTAPTVSAANVESCLTGASISVAATDVISSDSDNCVVVTREIKLSSAADSQYASSLSFSTAGDYAVTVRVMDAAGLTATATATVSVTTGPTGVLYSEDFEDESTNSDLCSPVYAPSDNNWTPLCPGGTSTISTLSAGDEAFRIEGITGSSLANTWESATFSVACLSNVLLTFDARSDGGLENSGSALDQFDVYAVQDGTETLLFGVDGHLDGTGGTTTVNDSYTQAIGLSDVSQLSIRIKTRLSGTGEFYYFDDFKVCVDENDNGLCDVDECTTTTVTASAATVSLGTDGQVTVDGTTVSAGFAGDCFTPTSYEVSTDGTTYAGSVSYGCSDLGGNTLYVRATDGNSTTDAITVTVTVQDYAGPFAAFGNDIDVVLAADGTYTLDADDIAAIDNGSYGTCSATLSVSPNSFTCGDLGANEAVLTISDGASSATANITITVKDETAPNVTVLSSPSVTLDANGGANLLPSDVSSLTGMADACTDNSNIVWQIKRSGDANFSDQISLGCSDVGFIQVQVQATDLEGNAFTSGDINLQVLDEIAPVLSGVTVMGAETLDSNEEAVLTASDFVDGATDNCGVTVYEISDSETTGFASTFTADCDDIQSGGKTFYFRVRDASQNTSNVISATIVITEDENPVAVANAITLNVASEGQSVSLSADNASFNGSSDNCSFTSLVKIVGSGADYASSVTFTATGTYSVTLQVTDPAGNSATSTAVVTVAILAVDGCIDPTACNYDPSANTDDGTCHYPGQECQSPSAGQGFVYTVNTGLTGCDCTAQNFTELYSEDFTGDLNSGVVDGTPTDYVSLCPGGFSPTDQNWFTDGCDDGTIAFTNGAYSNAFVYPEDISNAPADLSFNYYATGGATTSFDLSFKSKTIAVTGYSDLSFDFDVVNLFTAQSGVGLEFSTTLDGVRTVREDVAGTFSRDDLDADLTGVSAANMVVEVRGFGDGPAADLYLDDIMVSAWGKEGCTDAAADNYDATAQVDDLSCSYSFTTAYSLYDGGFGDPLWRGTECGGDCGAGPFFDAKPIAALTQTSQTTFNYVISSGTKVTVDGTLAADDGAAVQDLFVRNLTIESGGELVIPSGKRLRIVGDFLDLDGNGITGGGEFCIDDSGRFLFCTAELNSGNACPTEVTIPNLAIASGGALDIPEEAKVKVTGDLTFEDAAPQLMEGLLVMGGSLAQAIRGNGATVDRLQISNTTGAVSVDGRLAVQGRLTLDAESNLDMGGDTLVFASVAITEGGIEKTGLLDAVPTNASLTGPNGGPAKVQVQRFIGRDNSFTPQNGYFQYASPIENVTVGDFAQTDGFYSAGWPGSAYPNWIQTILFWDESEGQFVAPTSNSTPLDTLGGAWLYLLSTQQPTLITNGALKGYAVDDTFDFDLTRSETTSGWNLVYNPFQGRLDWDQVVSANGSYNNETLVEDAVLVYDSQQQVFLRYTSDESNANIRTKNAYIEPGQSFYVRLKDDFEQSGAQTFTLSPSMLDNAATGADFIRFSESEAERVVIRTTNAYGISHAVIHVDDAAEEDKNLTYLYSSNAKVGQMTIAQDGEEFVAHSLTLDEESKPVTVFSKAGVLTQLRVDEVVGQLEACMYIEDLQTGDILPIEEGATLNFNPEEDITTDRFVLKMAPQALTTAVSADCPGPEEMGSIQVDLMGWSSDVTLYDGDMQVLQSVVAVEGEVSFAVPPGLYSMLIQTEEGVCKEVRRIAEVWPAEQPELLGLAALPAECNVGEAALAFELYGGGEFQASLWQGGAPVWQESLQPGEYEIGGFAPGEYVLKVDHTCLEAVELVSLSDPGMPSVSALYDAFVEVESSGGAWLEAQCVGCLEGDGFGYYWILDGDIVAEDEPLSTRVYGVGSYDLQLVAFGPDCEMAVPFEVLVGKHKIGSPDAVRWLGLVEDHLMAVFDEEWSGVQCRWYDASGRLLDAQQGVTLVGEAFLPVPDATGWLTLEVRSADGRVARWSGIR